MFQILAILIFGYQTLVQAASQTQEEIGCLNKTRNSEGGGAEYVALVSIFVNVGYVSVASQQSLKSYRNKLHETAPFQIEKRLLRYWNVFLCLIILGHSIVATVIYFDPTAASYHQLTRRQLYYTLYGFEFTRDIALTVLMTVFIIRALETNVLVSKAKRSLSKKIKLIFIGIGLTTGMSAFICYLLSWLSRRTNYVPYGTLRYYKIYLIIRDLTGAIGMAITAHSVWTVRETYYETWSQYSSNITDKRQLERAEKFLKRSKIIVVFCIVSMVLTLSDLITAIPDSQKNFPLVCVNRSPWALLFQMIGIWVICSSVYFWLWTGCGIGPTDKSDDKLDEAPRASGTDVEMTSTVSQGSRQVLIKG